MSVHISELIELGDSDELIREIDRLCAQRNWADLLILRNGCHSAVERGKQLWGAASHAEYRLALEAPAEYVGAVIDAIPGRFALGPLSEVAACTHTWAELEPFLPQGPMREITAYECVASGTDLSNEPNMHHYLNAFDLPLRLQEWEPLYPVANYRANDAKFPFPGLQILSTVRVEQCEAKLIDEPIALESLLQLVQAWTTQSNGCVKAVAVEGEVSHALSAIGVGLPGSSIAQGDHIVQITSQSALALMAWAGASGGAHGRRSGMASGRAKAWWAVAGIAAVSEQWPLPAEEIGRYSQELQWWTWNTDNASEGWELHLAVVDSVDGIAFAIDAFDSAELG